MATYHSLNIACGMTVAGLEAGAQQARGIIRGLARDINNVGSVRDRLDSVVKSGRNATAVMDQLSTKWNRWGSDQTLWRHYDPEAHRRYLAGETKAQRGALDTAIHTVASYHALRVTIFSVATAAELFREHMERSHHYSEGMKHAVGAIEQSFHEASKSMHHMIATAGRNVVSFFSGDTSALPRDSRADIAAQVALEHNQRVQAQWAQQMELNRRTVEHRKSIEEDAYEALDRVRRQREESFQGFRDSLFVASLPKQMGAYEQSLEVMLRNLQQSGVTVSMIEFQQLQREARAVDSATRAEQLRASFDQRAGGRIGRALSLLAREQRPNDPRGGAGSMSALLLGSREEYQARVGGQRQNQDRAEDRRHKREVERAQKEANKWLQKILQAQGGTHSIPGGV